MYVHMGTVHVLSAISEYILKKWYKLRNELHAYLGQKKQYSSKIIVVSNLTFFYSTLDKFIATRWDQHFANVQNIYF